MGFPNGGTTTILANNGNNRIALWSNLTEAHVFAGAGNDTVSTYDGFTTIDTGPEGSNPAAGDIVQVNVDRTDPRRSTGDGEDGHDRSPQRPARVRTRQRRRFPTGVTIDITNSLALQGVIDMNGGAMIVRNAAAQIGILRNLIKTGRNNGAWNGPSTGDGSINSSLAASSSGGTRSHRLRTRQRPVRSGAAQGTFAGVSVDANCSLWHYTMCGDADLNGVVNFNNYSQIDDGFNTGGSDWSHGDFDYNETINFDDYALINLAFNGQSSPGRPGNGQTRGALRIGGAR